MSNWKAGDKALCISGSKPGAISPFIQPNGGMKVGTVYLVESTDILERPRAGAGEQGLLIAGFPLWSENRGRYEGRRCSRFRKIVPACDRNEREQTELHPHAGFWQGSINLIDFPFPPK